MSDGKYNGNPRRLSIQMAAILMIVLLLAWYFFMF